MNSRKIKLSVFLSLWLCSFSSLFGTNVICDASSHGRAGCLSNTLTVPSAENHLPSEKNDNLHNKKLSSLSNNRTILSRTEDITLPLVRNGDVSLLNLFRRGLNLVGKVMYIWGGGRHIVPEKQLRQIDVVEDKYPHDWDVFREKQNSNYNFKDYCIVSTDTKGDTLLGVKYDEIKNGLDCSGYMAYLLKNTIRGDAARASYIIKARNMAKLFADYRLGKYTDFGKITCVHPGDIVSMNKGFDDNGNYEHESHVYLALGQCNDGSVLLVDMSPPTIRIRGTRDNVGSRDKSGKLTSLAISIAEAYMRKYFPQTYKKFPNCTCLPDSYRLDSKMSWDVSSPNCVMTDPEGLQSKSVQDVLAIIFNE